MKINKIKNSLSSKTGITLIALIITIIVLLILAGVSISLVVGNNGVLTQASNSVVKNREASAKEEVVLAISSAESDYWTDWAKNSSVDINSYFTYDILHGYAPGVQSVTTPSATDGGFQVTYRKEGVDYTFNVDANRNVTLATSETAASVVSTAASVVSTEASTYYGKTVNYSLTGTGYSDIKWKIFYADSNNIFIIADDYLAKGLLPTDSGMTASTTDANHYNVYWNSVTSYDNNNQQLSLFKATGYTGTSNSNAKCVSKLLNTEIWSVFKNQTYADYAIGSPTIEMWVESWNNMYSSQRLQYSPTANSQSSSGNGYQVGEYGGTLGNYIDGSVMQEKNGYNNTLYYPHPDPNGNPTDGCYGYWLASPSAASGYDVMRVYCDGYVDLGNYNYDDCGVRPLVCLKSGVTLTENTTTTGIDYDINVPSN